MATSPSAADARSRTEVAENEQDLNEQFQAFIAHANDSDSTSSLSSTTFKELFDRLRIEDFIVARRQIHLELSEGYAHVIRAEPIQKIFEEFMSSIGKIVRSRRLAGYSLDLGDYSCLLQCARVAGNGDAALDIWKEMALNNVVPDTLCYNRYLAARCFSESYSVAGRHKIRVTPHNMQLRQSRGAQHGFKGVKTGRGGIREEATALMAHMKANGVEGDSTTCALLITALAREGDVDGVRAVLNDTWNIDVGGILTEDEADLDPVKSIEKGSRLYPDESLLVAVADAFGMNNDIPTAIRLVDYISRQFDIQIPLQVWETLLQWTFVLSRPRHGARRYDGTSEGKLPLSSVANLWETMVSEPYNVKPTMPMYNRLIKNLQLRQCYYQALDRILEAQPLSSLSKRNYFQAARQLRAMAADKTTAAGAIDHQQRETENLRLIMQRDRVFLRRWFRLLLCGGRTYRRPHPYHYQTIPDIVRKWGSYLPEKVLYRVPGGMVSFRNTYLRRGSVRTRAPLHDGRDKHQIV